jgi:anti-anti-sigma factor
LLRAVAAILEDRVNISISKQGDLALISVEGRIDTMSAPELEKRLVDQISLGDARLVVDFGAVDYISSAGLRSLMVAAKKASAGGGKLSCCRLTGVVKKVFEISGFSTILPVYENVEDAINQS